MRRDGGDTTGEVPEDGPKTRRVEDRASRVWRKHAYAIDACLGHCTLADVWSGRPRAARVTRALPYINPFGDGRSSNGATAGMDEASLTVTG
ncbi:hypothetical protein GCM10010390_26880 [Streptomyces mordarskii]|uniref:Uncharacterized protein n=1 Tax=Streptomyces mordarskii TaxID=1226758 RepID=A0ABN1CQX9_9ACTN